MSFLSIKIKLRNLTRTRPIAKQIKLYSICILFYVFFLFVLLFAYFCLFLSSTIRDVISNTIYFESPGKYTLKIELVCILYESEIYFLTRIAVRLHEKLWCGLPCGWCSTHCWSIITLFDPQDKRCK